MDALNIVYLIPSLSLAFLIILMCLAHNFLTRMHMLLFAHLSALVAVVTLRLSVFAFFIIAEVDDSLSLAHAEMHLFKLESIHQNSLRLNHSIIYLSDI